MKPILFFDTETTSLPLWKEPSDHPDQPHLVQLAAILVNPDTREMIAFMDVIIKPDGWTIPEETIAIHGITNERALSEGIPETEALDMFLSLHSQCGIRVAYNESFDARIVGIASFRYAAVDVIDAWKDAPAQCAMKMAKPICKIPAPANARRFGPYKNPTLTEAYKHFTGAELVGAHSAMTDAKACMEVYFHCVNQEETACVA
ncbi:MAG: 3'-5' exonuclease [Gammaproteobacteria bacterium]|nr:3'-5' exonuclease [Gammaproteobacteria bacterium]MDP2346846.1 3'-5' exonuclease [Gammaproteobacteria bacterium]